MTMYINQSISPRKGDDQVPSPRDFENSSPIEMTSHEKKSMNDSDKREDINNQFSDQITLTGIIETKENHSDHITLDEATEKLVFNNTIIQTKIFPMSTDKIKDTIQTDRIDDHQMKLFNKRNLIETSDQNLSTKSILQERPPRPKQASFKDRPPHKNGIPKRSSSLTSAMKTLNRVSHEISKWINAAAYQMDSCNGSMMMIDQLKSDEIEFNEVESIIKKAQNQVRNENMQRLGDRDPKKKGLIDITPSLSNQVRNENMQRLGDRDPKKKGLIDITPSLSNQQQQNQLNRFSYKPYRNYMKDNFSDSKSIRSLPRFPMTSTPTSVVASEHRELKDNKVDDVFWDNLKTTTSFVISKVGQWVNDTIVNSENASCRAKQRSSLFTSVPLQSTQLSSQCGQPRSTSLLQLQSQSVNNQKNRYSRLPLTELKRVTTPTSSARTTQSMKSVMNRVSRPMSENIHKTTFKPLWSSHDLLNNLSQLKTKVDLHSNRQCSRHQSIHPMLSIHQHRKTIDPPRLPPPPTPDELVRPSRSSLMTKSFRSNFWKEPELKRQKLTLPPATLWQGLWHSIDVETKRVRLLRRRNELYGQNGPSSRQILERLDVCDSSPLTWREAWKSHLELTIFSIENSPYIGQVVIDSDGFRLDLPFRVQFVRIPIYRSDQIVTVWFNSAYPRPYRRRRSKLLFTRVITDPDDLSEESDDDEDEDIRDALEDDFITNDEIISLTNENLLNCTQLDSISYDPHNDWKTYFRFDIPLSSIIQYGNIEDSAIISPQQIFYHNNKDSLGPDAMFSLLRREAKVRPFDPKIKFCIKCHFQGLKNLICTGDTLPLHSCSLPSQSKLISRHSSKQNSSDLVHPVNPNIFDVHRRLYRPIKQMAKFPSHERPIYVGAYDDSVDLQVALELNRLNSSLLNATQGHQIERLCRGLYSIYGNEYRVERLLIDSSSSNLDLSELELQPNDVLITTPNSYYKTTDHPQSKLYIAIVFGDNFHQPFHNFVMRTRTNFFLTPTSMENKQQQQQSLNQLKLPNLMLSNSDLPWGPRNDPRELFRLTQHAKAITANLKSHFGYEYLSHDDHALIEKHLSPPIIQMTEDSLPSTVTFFWSGDLSNVFVAPVDLNEGLNGGIPYLVPYSSFENNPTRLGSHLPSTQSSLLPNTHHYQYCEKPEAETFCRTLSSNPKLNNPNLNRPNLGTTF